MTKELVTFTVCSLYLIHFVSEEKLYSVPWVKRLFLLLDKNCGRFLANSDISACSGLF